MLSMLELLTITEIVKCEKNKDPAITNTSPGYDSEVGCYICGIVPERIPIAVAGMLVSFIGTHAFNLGFKRFWTAVVAYLAFAAITVSMIFPPLGHANSGLSAPFWFSMHSLKVLIEALINWVGSGIPFFYIPHVWLLAQSFSTRTAH
eukprot:m.12122 g.12122  ORF g.12122 m.12122 type:complete len:148 (+) comp4519_c0_seq1:1019-1462(+)